MNKNYFLVGLLLCGLPLVITAQQSGMAGIWLLTDKQHFQGPSYGNGVPKILTISEKTGNTILALTTTVGDKDTVELEAFGPDQGHTLVERTAKGRQKIISLIRRQQQNLWIRNVNMSSKDNVNETEITIVDSLQLSDDSNHLTFTRYYKGAGVPGSNEDYVMVGTYKKTSPEQIARETAIGKGVVWTVGLTWPQVLEKARQEKKYVFVDCYATWCGPCKTMDREVFPLNWVGEAMNDQFLAVKVQMDTGKNDPSPVRLTYPIARQLEQKYKIETFPCYLFIDGNGQLVHKAVGSFKASDFVNILQQAASPSSQIYTRYREALAENLPLGDLPTLALRLAAPQYGEQELAKTLIRLYIDRQFYPLSDEALLTRDNLEFIVQYWSVIKSKDRIFKLFHHDPNKINQILGKKSEDDFAQQRIEDIIWQEEINPIIQQTNSTKKTLDWKALETTIAHKYGNYYIARPILNAKVWWYYKQQQWELYCKYLNRQVIATIKIAPDQWDYFNSVAWNMFIYSTNKKQLEASLQWTQRSMNQQIIQKIQGSPMLPTCDTYANLLYKLGRKQEAIAYYQKMVINRLPKAIQPPVWANTINRMKQGLPTWKNREKWAGE